MISRSRARRRCAAAERRPSVSGARAVRGHGDRIRRATQLHNCDGSPVRRAGCSRRRSAAPAPSRACRPRSARLVVAVAHAPGRSAARRRRGSGSSAGRRRTRSRRPARAARGRRGRRGGSPAPRNRSVCQASISSVMPLNVLPSMTKLAGRSGSRAPRWMLESQPRRRPRAPLDGEHHEVEGVDRLDLHPGRAAAAGGVGRVEVLDDDALVAGGEHLGDERLGLLGGRR